MKVEKWSNSEEFLQREGLFVGKLPKWRSRFGQSVG